MREYNEDEAMENSYKVIFRGFDPLLMIYEGNGWFAHDFRDNLVKNDIENMLHYYESKENYSRCIEIKKLIDIQWNLENTK
tara:strand:+ start:182 stop:424 length:243 start_codon:yes stop_codon:yes gene_type:complete